MRNDVKFADYDRKIRDAWATLFAQNERIPSNSQIATHLGISEMTVWRHLKEVPPHEILTDERKMLTVMINPNAPINYAFYLIKKRRKSTRDFHAYFSLAFGKNMAKSTREFWEKPVRIPSSKPPWER